MDDLRLLEREKGNPSQPREWMDKARPLLELCDTVRREVHPDHRPHGVLHALGIKREPMKRLEQPWTTLTEALRAANREEAMPLLGLLLETGMASSIRATRGALRSLVLNKAEWRIEAIETYPELFRGKTAKAPLQAADSEAPGSRDDDLGLQSTIQWRADYPNETNPYFVFARSLNIDEPRTAAGVPHSRATLQALVRIGTPLVGDQVHRETPMHCAAILAPPARVTALAQVFPQLLEMANARGNTPLHEAVIARNDANVRALLDAGANAVALSYSGDSPLDKAVEQRHVPTIAAILSDHRVAADQAGLRRALTWVEGNEAIPSVKGHPEIAAMLQAALARSAINGLAEIARASARSARSAP